MILWGDIAEFPLFSVLQFLAAQRRTGVLEIQDFEEQGAVYLSAGRIEAISLAQADEEFGSRLVAAGALTETEVKECWMRWSSDDEGPAASGATCCRPPTPTPRLWWRSSTGMPPTRSCS